MQSLAKNKLYAVRHNYPWRSSLVAFGAATRFAFALRREMNDNY